MPRARLLKPGFFKNEELARLSPYHRLCFAGLWLLADREGRLEDRPERIKAELFPYEDAITVPAVHRILHDLAVSRLIVRYGIKGGARRVFRYIAVPTFLDHQSPHIREPKSEIPAPPARPRAPRSKPLEDDDERRREMTIGAPSDVDREPIGATYMSIASPSLANRELSSSEESTGSGSGEHQSSITDPVPVPVPVPDPETETETVPRVRAGGGGADTAARHDRGPIFKGRRLVIFGWMRADLEQLLGPFAEAFDLDAWFTQLDAAVDRVLPATRDARWEWLQHQLVEEAARRGFPIASTGNGNAVADDAVWASIRKLGPAS